MDFAVIGLGHMGNAVAERLLEGGATVRAWNRTEGKASEAVANGATIAASAKEAAAGADVVLVVLADDAALITVLADQGVARQVVDDDSVLVNLGTVSPETSRKAADYVDARYVEAPILAPPAGMRAGTAALLVAGRDGAVEKATPAFDALGGPTTVVGTRIGAASKLKLVSNQLLIGNSAVLAEAIATARRAGVDDDDLRDFLKASAHIAPGLANRIDRFIDADVDPMFSIDNAAKDLGLALELAGGDDADRPVTRAAAELLQRVSSDDRGGDDLAAIVTAPRR